MTGRIVTCDGTVYDLPPLLEWTVVYTGTVPCDTFAVTCPYKPDMADVLHRAVGFLALNGSTVLLRGIVDEYRVELSENGMDVSVEGRGYAARLLDNESRAITYQGATLQEILHSHVEPYGITWEAADLRAASVYTVASGSSQWKALNDFCQTYGGWSPRFSREGTLITRPETDSGNRIQIGDRTPLLSLTKRENHYGVLSEVLVVDKTRNASYSVKDADWIGRGGCCRRVLYTPGKSTSSAMRYTGEYQIAQSRTEEMSIELQLPEVFTAFPGDLVQIQLTGVGMTGEYRVAEAENSLSEKGKTAVLTLKEK